MTVRPAIIIVAYSARALAASAKEAGFAPLSIDVFGDDDMREMSFASVKLDGGLSGGLTLDKVAGAVEMLITAHDPVGLVYGAGFEDQPVRQVHQLRADVLYRIQVHYKPFG